MCVEKRQRGDGRALRAPQRVLARGRDLRAGGLSPSVLDGGGVVCGSDGKVGRLGSPVWVYPPLLDFIES